MKQKRLWVTIATFILTMFNASPAFARQINWNAVYVALFILFLIYALPFVVSMLIVPKSTRKRMFILNLAVYGISLYIGVLPIIYPYDPFNLSEMAALDVALFGVVLPCILILIALIVRILNKKNSDSSNCFKA